MYKTKTNLFFQFNFINLLNLDFIIPTIDLELVLPRSGARGFVFLADGESPFRLGHTALLMGIMLKSNDPDRW